MTRGQLWTLIRGSAQHRVLIITNNEYNAVDGVPLWALAVTRDAPPGSQLSVALAGHDPLPGAHVRVHAVVQIIDRTALRHPHGLVSHPTMTVVEEALRDLLELPGR